MSVPSDEVQSRGRRRSRRRGGLGSIATSLSKVFANDFYRSVSALINVFQPQVQERQVLGRHFVHRRRRLSFASFATFVETKNKNCESI